MWPPAKHEAAVAASLRASLAGWRRWSLHFVRFIFYHLRLPVALEAWSMMASFSCQMQRKREILSVWCWVGLSASSDTNYKLGTGYVSWLHGARFPDLTNSRRVSVHASTSQTCYFITDPLRLVMSDRIKYQLVLTFPHASSFGLPVIPVELSSCFRTWFIILHITTLDVPAVNIAIICACWSLGLQAWRMETKKAACP